MFGKFLNWSRIIVDDFELFSQVFNINDFWIVGRRKLCLDSKSVLGRNCKTQQNAPFWTRKQKENLGTKTICRKRKTFLKPRLDDKCLTSWNAIMLKKVLLTLTKLWKNQKYWPWLCKTPTSSSKICGRAKVICFTITKTRKATINGYLEDYSSVMLRLSVIVRSDFWRKMVAKCKTNWLITVWNIFMTRKIGLFALPPIGWSFDYITFRNRRQRDSGIQFGSMGKLVSVWQLFWNRIRKSKPTNAANTMPGVDYSFGFIPMAGFDIELLGKGKQGIGDLWRNAIGIWQQNKTICISQTLFLLNWKSVQSSFFLKDRFIGWPKNLFYLCQNKTCLIPTNDFQKIVSDLI